MAQRVNIELICDFCAAADRPPANKKRPTIRSALAPTVPGDFEQPAAETLPISIGGPVYEVDLCDEHLKQMRELRSLVHEVGRTKRVGVARQKPRPFNPDSRDEKSKRTQALRRVRAWAIQNGYEISGNARVPYRVQRAYNEANPDDVVPLADGGQGPAARR